MATQGFGSLEQVFHRAQTSPVGAERRLLRPGLPRGAAIS